MFFCHLHEKVGIDAAKTAPKTAEATRDLIGNKKVEKATSAGKT